MTNTVAPQKPEEDIKVEEGMTRLTFYWYLSQM